MSQDLIFATVVLIFTCAGVFVGYWSGVARAESTAADREQFLLNELDDACELIDDLLTVSSKAKHPSVRSLQIVKDGA